MIGVAVLVVIAILPLLAYLGAFRAGRTSYIPVTMMTQPLPKEPKQERVARKPERQPPHVAARKAGQRTPQSTKPLPVHVAASASAGPPSENSIVNGSNTEVGKIPVPAPPPGPAPSATEVTPSQAQPLPPPPVKPPPAPVAPAAPAPAPVPAPVPPPHVPVVVAAVALSQPQPQVPDDMLADDLDATCKVLLTIHADGTVDASQEKSSGNAVLDKLALNAVRKWRFRPATRDGVPTESYLHVDVDFRVS
jgi:protein TonB